MRIPKLALKVNRFDLLVGPLGRIKKLGRTLAMSGIIEHEPEPVIEEEVGDQATIPTQETKQTGGDVATDRLLEGQRQWHETEAERLTRTSH